MDKIKLLELLLKNKNKDFINRIINVNDFPVLENRDGTKSTHSMSLSEVDGKFFVYPSVVYQDGKMQRLGPDTAFNRAISSGDMLEFDDLDEATGFSKDYKQFMPLFEASGEKVLPKKETIWKDMNTGPGTIESGDSL
jgi:hypothetical protein